MTNHKDQFLNALSIVLLFLAVMGVFLRVLVSEKNLYGGDFILYFYPLKSYIQAHLFAYGSVPFWNPYQFSGTPVISNIQAAMFYPLGFLYYVMPVDRAYLYSTVIHCLLGGVFMVAFMRALSVGVGACWISAVVFSLNGYFMGHLYAGHLTFVQAYIWIPLLFHLLYSFIQKDDFKVCLSAGVVFGIQILAGFPQIAFYTILGASLFVLFRGLVLSGEFSLKQALRKGEGLCLVVAVGFGIAAVQVLPTMEFAALSTRSGGVSYEMATYESLHPKELLAFLIPEIFGNPIDQTYWRSPDFWHFWESCGYVGILPLMLLFIKTEDRSLRSLRICFWALLLLSLFLALGRFNPLYPWIYHVPGFKNFRIPAQIIFLYVFAVAVLSGMGLDRMLQKEWEWQRIFMPLTLSAGLLLAAVTVCVHWFPYPFFFFLFRNFTDQPVSHANLDALYQRVSLSVDKTFLVFLVSWLILLAYRNRKIRAPFMHFMVPGILFADLFLFGNQFVRPYAFTPSTEKETVSRQLPRNPSEGRVFTAGELFRANDGLRYGFPSVLGYDPLILRRYAEFISASQHWPYDEHLVNLEHLSDPSAKLLKQLNLRWQVLDNAVQGLENDLPYAFLVRNGLRKPLEQILSFMGSGEFDPRQMVVLESKGGQEMQQDAVEPELRSGEVLSYAPDAMSLKVSAKASGYLVLSEIFYPGWVATVDGKSIDVLCGNYLFRVIPLDQGEHRIHFRFISWPFRIGVAISCLTFIVLIPLMRRKRKG